MAGLVPAIHVFVPPKKARTWMPATSAGMTVFVGNNDGVHHTIIAAKSFRTHKKFLFETAFLRLP